MAWLGKILSALFKILFALVLVSLVAGPIFLWWTGAWNIVFPSSQHDERAPALPDELGSPAILVFSKTNQFRHKDGIAGGNKALLEIADAEDWAVFATENGAVFNPEDLARFDAVVFQNATGDMLNDAQEQAFQTWLEAGGGWLGIHAAGDGSHAGWQWYMENLIGAEFTAHIMGPQFQFADLTVEATDHPAMADVSATWRHEEEWYSWKESPRPRGFNILATIDEESYTPYQKIMGNEVDLRMGDHPVVWSNCVVQGRALYSALGHRAEAFDNPEYRQLLTSALRWVLGLSAGGC